MTKKHFIAVARDIAAQRAMIARNEDIAKRIYGSNVLDETARNLASTFAGLNSNFDRARFLTACGVE